MSTAGERGGTEPRQGAGRINGQCPEHGGHCTLKHCRETTETRRLEGLVRRSGVQAGDVSTTELLELQLLQVNEYARSKSPVYSSEGHPRVGTQPPAPRAGLRADSGPTCPRPYNKLGCEQRQTVHKRKITGTAQPSRGSTMTQAHRGQPQEHGMERQRNICVHSSRELEAAVRPLTGKGQTRWGPDGLPSGGSSSFARPQCWSPSAGHRWTHGAAPGRQPELWSPARA